MTDHRLNFESNLAELGKAEWTARLDALTEELGYTQQLGASHMAVFLDAGPKLLVTFEDAELVRQTPSGEPLGFQFTRENGYSHLAILSEGTSWFRAEEIYRFFDRLIDDGFFDDFDSVLFHGAHNNGYAAAAFSVAAPGCRVYAIRPQATLDPRITGWDPRHFEQRRHDFTTRYGYAPDMIDATERTYIAFDPVRFHDSAHAALFTKPNMQQLRCKFFGWQIDRVFSQMGIADDLIRHAMDGTLDDPTFARLLRGRRTQEVYLRALFTTLVKLERYAMAETVCRHAMSVSDSSFFRTRMDELVRDGHIRAPRGGISAAS